MFAVEIHIQNDDSLADAMTGIRQWLDHRRFEPSIFRYTFVTQGILMHIEFPVEDEAVEFAAAFSGQVVARPAASAPTSALERQFLDGAANG